MNPAASEPVLRRNAELHEQAKRKASALDDGTKVGELKGKLILALDNLRNKRALVSLWGVFADGGDGYCADQHALAQVDTREAYDEVLALCDELEGLGVRVNLVRRTDYDQVEPTPADAAGRE